MQTDLLGRHGEEGRLEAVLGEISLHGILGGLWKQGHGLRLFGTSDTKGLETESP